MPHYETVSLWFPRIGKGVSHAQNQQTRCTAVSVGGNRHSDSANQSIAARHYLGDGAHSGNEQRGRARCRHRHVSGTYRRRQHANRITSIRGSRKVYSSDEAANQLTIINADTVAFVGTVPMGTGSKPHHMMASEDGRYIYVAEFGFNTVGVVDTVLDENVVDLLASYISAAKTHAVWIDSNGKDLYATNEATPSGTFSKIDVQSGGILWEEPVGNRPSEVLVDRGTAYVSIRNENVIKLFDVTGADPVYKASAEANTMPDTLSLTNDKRTLIVGLRGSPARMAFIDTASLVTTYLPLPGGTTGHQWLSSDGRFTYIALETPGQVAVVDNRYRQLVTTYPYPNGLTRPHGVFYEPPRNIEEPQD
jgi:DNA-binding beta-propeller fold protein YncE